MDSNINIGERIIRLRKLKGMSQQELADRLKVNRGTITNYENNYTDITIKQLIELSKVFEVSLLELIADPVEDTETLSELNTDRLNERLQLFKIEVSFLKKEIADKNKIIRVYEEGLEADRKRIEELTKLYQSSFNQDPS